MAKLLKLIMKESIQSASDTLQKIKEYINQANSSLKPDVKDVYVVKNNATNKYDIMMASNDGNSVIVSVDYSDLPEEDLRELNILKEDTTESVVLRDEAEKVINESEVLSDYFGHFIRDDIAEYGGPVDFERFVQRGTDNGELYDMAFEEYGDREEETMYKVAEELYNKYLADCDEYLANNSSKEESMKEDYYLNINDGKQEDTDYLIQDVTELEDLNDEDVESPSIDGLLSLVNESLTEKYGTTWGYMKAHSIAKKESLQYAIIDIVTPSILKEAEQAKIKDKAVSKTVILENVPNSKKLVNLKVNTLAGTTRFSQKTAEPAKVFARWLESEYLYDEMVKDFQDKLLARQQELKASTDNYLKEHPDLALRVDTLNAQAKILKDANMMDYSKPELQDLMYGLVAEFPFNTTVEESKDEYSQSFDTTDKLVEMLFGKEFVKEDTAPDNKVEKTKTKHKVVSTKTEKIKESSLKEGYESFKIGEIEGTFNPDTLEVMYSIPSENVKDKKINLTKVPSVETPYNTDTIIKDYVEKNYGNIPAEDSSNDVTINADDVNIENEPSTPAPTEDNSDEGEADLDMTDEEVTEADELPEEPAENAETPAENNEESQSETGTGSFYKVRQREPVNIDNLLEKAANGANTQESEYIVVKTEELSQEDMDSLLSDLSKPQSFLQNVEPIDRKNYAFNVVKVTSPSSPYTLFIDPVGYNYPRYISISQ